MYENTVFNYLFNNFKFNKTGIFERELDDPHRIDKIIGLLYFIFGAVSLPLYIPFLVAMLHPNNLRLPVYKIMVILSCSDILNLCCAGLFSGYASFHGLDYFNSPAFSIMTGSSSYALWVISCFGTCILAFQRCLQMISSDLTALLFSGYRTWIWMSLPLLIGSTTYIYAPAFMFSTTMRTFVLNPYIGYSYISPIHFTNYVLLVTNSSTVILLSLFIYGMYKIKNDAIFKFNNKSDSTGMRMFFQTLAMCSATFVTAIAFMLQMLFDVPKFIAVTGHISLIATHSFPGVMFLCFNTTLKSTLKKWLFPKKIAPVTITKKQFIRAGNI